MFGDKSLKLIENNVYYGGENQKCQKKGEKRGKRGIKLEKKDKHGNRIEFLVGFFFGIIRWKPYKIDLNLTQLTMSEVS